jgi:hypothetical protein
MYIAKIKTTVSGIPSIIGVISYHSAKPNPRCHDSDVDFNGYIDIEFDVLDRGGRLAPWLTKKLTTNCTELLEEQIIKYFENDEY